MAVEAHDEFACVAIDSVDITDVAVVDVLVVVILDLHDLVTGGEGPAEPLDFPVAGGIESGLQFNVERSGADTAAVHSISLLISRMSENSSFSASRSQPESSPSRLSASRSIRNLASSRSAMVTAGTWVRPSLLAATANPQPAITRLSTSMTTGRTKPNCSMLACGLRICAGGCLRVSRPSGFKESTRTRFGSRLRDTAKPLPRGIGCRFIECLLQKGQARTPSGQISLRGTNAWNAPGIL